MKQDNELGRLDLEDGVRQRIRALGFFGMMTLGHSHPLHHMMMARGMRHGS